MHLLPLMAQSQTSSSQEIPKGVSCDGVNDYVYRSTTLTGAINSASFTFSCWFYITATSNLFRMGVEGTQGFQLLYNHTNKNITLTVTDSSFLNRLVATVPSGAIINQWNHILVSVNLANTANRYVYLNDILMTPTWSTYATTSTLGFSAFSTITPTGGYSGGVPRSEKRRTSNVYLDFTYRDLSIEANRRLFITADRLPTEDTILTALNPILYLPMTDATTAHINLGAGGNLIQSGVLETAKVGANQLTNRLSTFDGTTSKLTSTVSVNAVSQLTISIDFRIESANSSLDYILYATGSGANLYINRYTSSGSGFLYIPSTDGTYAYIANISNFVSIGETNSLQLSIDNANNKARLWINGKSISTIGVNSGKTITFSNLQIATNGTYYSNSSIGEFYLDTTFIDLNVSNPFWDSVNNKPIPVKQVKENLGSNPLVCMTIESVTPEVNLGSAGSFTKTGTLASTRNTSEYMSKSIATDASNYLTKSGGIYCASLVKWTSTDGGATWTAEYTNAETVTTINSNVVSYYFGFSDTINWADENNKNKVTNQLGYPIHPTEVLRKSGWTPVLGLFFDDNTNFGKNAYGADFTKVGTITNSSDIKI